jgi:AcrR family transcriptional regulator
MCPRTSRQFEEMRENKRRQIIDSAIECFATTGYHAVSISDLASHAGISKGLLYNYFASKEDLLKAIYSEIVEAMIGLFNPGHAGKMDKKLQLDYFEKLVSNLKSNLILWKMYLAIFSQPAVMMILEEDIQASAKKPREMMKKYFRKEGYKDPAVEVAFLSTLVSGMLYEYIADPEKYPLDAIKERIIRIQKLSSPQKTAR